MMYLKLLEDPLLGHTAQISCLIIMSRTLLLYELKKPADGWSWT